MLSDQALKELEQLVEASAAASAMAQAVTGFPLVGVGGTVRALGQDASGTREISVRKHA